jgi:GTP-binding protein HflX
MVRQQISRVKRELVQVVKHRQVQRKKRMTVPVPTCAIVGYTNAGKSSLLNRLTDSAILAEDKLFATLDPTSRRCKLPNGQTLVLTDTVGFVRNLPHRLVDAFKATLEEAVLANLLLHVIDVTSPEVEAHLDTTASVLKELGAGDKIRLIVFNKVDSLWDPQVQTDLSLQYPEAFFVSAHSGAGMGELLQKIERILNDSRERLSFMIPHQRYDIVAKLHREGAIYCERVCDEGIYLEASVPTRLLSSIESYQTPIQTAQPS